jgi:sec-independent protein translocase protein TatA
MRIGAPELILILLIVLLLFGTSRLAGLGKGLGQAIRGFKDEVDTKDDSKDQR